MDEALKKEHWQRISDSRARRMYNRLCDACEKRPEGMTDTDQMMVADVAYAEQMKVKLEADIDERGIGEKVRNGKQSYWAENKSMASHRAFTETQRKLLAELKLTPNKRKATAVSIDDDFDSFPD